MTELHVTDVIRQTKDYQTKWLNMGKDKLQVNSKKKKSFLNINQQSKENQKYHRRDGKPNLQYVQNSAYFNAHLKL